MYIVAAHEINPRIRREPMAFKPNYRRDRAERQRAARARTEEKQRKKEEKAALRKAKREATEAPPDEKQTLRWRRHSAPLRERRLPIATASVGMIASTWIDVEAALHR